MTTFADKILKFNNKLEFDGPLPNGIQIMNPFKDNQIVNSTTEKFYRKYYSDNKTRKLILGINPGRFGAGVTGIPFTDTKRLFEKCNIEWTEKQTHEISSVFIYDLIDMYGGVKKFYSNFYINSVCPLGFTKTQQNGKVKNYNYYDSKELTDSVYAFIVASIKKQLDFDIDNSSCFCLGTSDNFDFLLSLNNEYHFFKQIVLLEHPRYIMQYKKRNKQSYIEKYLNWFNKR